MFNQLYKALKHLHSDCCYSHNDIKPDNIQFIQNTGKLPTPKLIDMGFALQIKNRSYDKQITNDIGWTFCYAIAKAHVCHLKTTHHGKETRGPWHVRFMN